MLRKIKKQLGHVVIINGHRLDIFKDSFDWRKEPVKRR